MLTWNLEVINAIHRPLGYLNGYESIQADVQRNILAPLKRSQVDNGQGRGERVLPIITPLELKYTPPSGKDLASPSHNFKFFIPNLYLNSAIRSLKHSLKVCAGKNVPVKSIGHTGTAMLHSF